MSRIPLRFPMQGDPENPSRAENDWTSWVPRTQRMRHRMDLWWGEVAMASTLTPYNAPPSRKPKRKP